MKILAASFRPTMLLLCAAAIVFASPRFVQTEPAIKEQLKYYDVSGRSLRDVSGLILSASPITIDGKKHIGYCHYDIRWQYRYASDSGWCAITSVAVTVDITSTMPRWTDYPGAQPEAQEKWNSFFARLSEHEEGHARLYREAARDIEREIGSLKRRNCQELEEAVDETGNGLLKQLRTADEDYDAKTKHGALQGAVLQF